MAYAEEIRKEILKRISDGESLLSICRDEHMPHRTTVDDWREQDTDFSLQYARARDSGHDVIAERTRETARGKGDSTDDVARDKLIIDTDMRLLKAWNPKKYGDRVTHAGDPDAPIDHRHSSHSDAVMKFLHAKHTESGNDSGCAE